MEASRRLYVFRFNKSDLTDVLTVSVGMLKATDMKCHLPATAWTNSPK